MSLSLLYIVHISINESRESICKRGLFQGSTRARSREAERAMRYRKSRSSSLGRLTPYRRSRQSRGGPFFPRNTEEQNFLSGKVSADARKSYSQAVASRCPRLAAHSPFFKIDVPAPLYRGNVDEELWALHFGRIWFSGTMRKKGRTMEIDGSTSLFSYSFTLFDVLIFNSFEHFSNHWEEKPTTWNIFLYYILAHLLYCVFTIIMTQLKNCRC